MRVAHIRVFRHEDRSSFVTQHLAVEAWVHQLSCSESMHFNTKTDFYDQETCLGLAQLLRPAAIASARVHLHCSRRICWHPHPDLNFRMCTACSHAAAAVAADTAQKAACRQ